MGEQYTNDQIRFSLGIENLGGIRPSLDEKKQLRHIAVMTAAGESSRVFSENPYHDRIEDDVLIYTAQGREGDQQLAGRNRRLIEQYSNPVPFFGFINLGQQTYRFLGLLELLRHYQEMQADTRRELRRVWLFEFRIHRQPEVVSVEQAGAIAASLLGESRRAQPLFEQEREIAGLVEDGEQAVNHPIIADAETLRGQLLQISPHRFEHLVKAMMEASGFTAVSVTSASGDGGIDVNAYVDETSDFFAGTHVQAQVKRWRHAVGSVEINKFRGALSTTAKGVFITTSHFTRAAVAESRHDFKPCVTLIDGTKFSTMILRRSLDIRPFT